MKHFKNGTYSITPKHLRRRRKDLGLAMTTLNAIESLFGYIGDDDLTVFPSIATIASECDVHEDTAGWHIRYLQAQGALPTRHVRAASGWRRSEYDLSVLRDLNQRVHDAGKDADVGPLFAVSFSVWREQERQRQKGGKRGRRKLALATSAVDRETGCSVESSSDVVGRVQEALWNINKPYSITNVVNDLADSGQFPTVSKAELQRIIETGLPRGLAIRGADGEDYLVEAALLHATESRFASLVAFRCGK